jgi:hypothetical protein
VSAVGRARSGVDLTRGWEVVSADPEWPVKLGLFLLVWVVPILGWLVVMGWLSYGARRAIAGLSPVLLPPTSDLTTLLDYAEQGLKAFVVSLVWSLPAIAIVLATMGCLYFAMVASILTAVAGAQASDGGSLAMIPLFVCGAFVVFAALGVVNALLSLPAAAAALRAELSGVLGAGFDVSSVLDLVRKNLREWILNLVLLVLLTMLLVLVANLVPVLGVFVATFAIAIVRVFAGVSIYEKHLAAGGAPIALGPMEPRASAPVAMRR